jgi:hypothetical protein
VLKVLVKHANKLRMINTRDKHGWTALHYASRGRMYGAIELLIDAKADPNLQSAAGYTPLDVLLTRAPRHHAGDLHKMIRLFSSAGV